MKIIQNLIQDCSKSCSPIPPDIPVTEFKIFNFDGWLVIALILIVVLLLTFVTSIFVVSYCRKSSHDEYRPTGKEENFSLFQKIRFLCYVETSTLIDPQKSPGIFARVRKHTERFLERIFFR
jgi:hypothetical protein